jgi:hypothetical protein
VQRTDDDDSRVMRPAVAAPVGELSLPTLYRIRMVYLTAENM